MIDSEYSPAEYCQKQISHFKNKASHNKNESLWCFRLIMIGTLLAPLFVSLGGEMWTGKVIPSFLSVLAAFCTAWMQLRKPNELWSLYRTAERELESHLVRYTFKIDDYSNTESADNILVKNVTDLTLKVHKSWIPIIPTSENLPKNDSN
ncbi:DUF4231 domain-containing protein [Celerinatantimonas diazotrophica]|uniref:Uncharacterized protein DUF4231 n=1 Tax=Celerinatantimonas diazotrophica TaxID=412034 RepID=A0A4R1K1C5_9GAMM|nr:DUF4231 domain-containing protein [Celerinatantimonas diazotrophica]TCK57752.1 uncharacterized protein DUF4231 [Celerinatantimonas diazotrophica]CAG9298186.1 hypothetical protein CEDIAZO_03381 [Celerinatantimonas diazotrophica]